MAIDPRTAFHGTLLRLQESARQRARFQDLWKLHLQSMPWTFSLQQNEPLEYSLMAQEGAPVPPQLGVYFSSWLQQQRAALDNALYALAGVRGGNFPPVGGEFMEFPVAESLKEFKGRRTIKAKILDAETESFLERNQPYWKYSGELAQEPLHSPLYWLNEMARIDRHRMMHVGVGSIRISDSFTLHAGADRIVKHVVKEGQLLAGKMPVLTFTTTQPLRSTKLRFILRPEILPEIAEWSGAKALIPIYGTRGLPIPSEVQWIEGYKPLGERMDDVENTIRDICTRMVVLAGFDPAPFWHLPGPDSSSRCQRYEEGTPEQARRLNGG